MIKEHDSFGCTLDYEEIRWYILRFILRYENFLKTTLKRDVEG